MYCPRCATQNVDGSKFCRQCGMRLEEVALALLEGISHENETKATAISHRASELVLEKRREALRRVVQGGGLLTASSLLGVALAVFSNQPDWIIIWLVLVGWIAVLGVMSLASGIGKMLESRMVSAEMKGSHIQSLTGYPAPIDGRAALSEPATANRSLPPSVTENTTELLIDPHSENAPTHQ